jgi:PAS domain-containing protein
MVSLCTKFANAKIASRTTVKNQVNLLKNTPLLSQLFNSINEVVIILNKERQVVYANNNLLSMLKLKSPDPIFGKRPGELLNCIHATEGLGCGTTEFCRVCGAVKAIIKSQLGERWTEECRIITKKTGGDYNLLVKATPLLLKRYKFTIFTIKDISNEKRRRALEKIFFHDVLNTVTRLKIASVLLEKKKHVKKASKIVSKAVNELKDNIDSQKILLAAENFDLEISPTKLNSKVITKDLIERYKDFAKKNR